MPRSYSFDHFQVPKTMTPTPERGRKKGATKKANAGSTGKISYGKKFAETEELYQAHVMEAQLEELAGVTKEEASPRMSRGADADPIDRMRKSAPIGAMPTAELGKKKLRDFWSDGMRHVQLFREGTRDILNAASFFLHMPRDMMRSLLRRNREQEA